MGESDRWRRLHARNSKSKSESRTVQNRIGKNAVLEGLLVADGGFEELLACLALGLFRLKFDDSWVGGI